MIGSRIMRLVCAATVTLVAVVGSAKMSFADSPPDAIIDLPAGIACPFALHIEIRGFPQVSKEFRNGHTLLAGKGSALTFTNLDTGATLKLQANGSVLRTTGNSDGSSTQIATGHNVIILFPTDIPAGPSTTLYVGRVVYKVDSSEIFTVKQVSGQSTDICAALS